MLPTSKEYPKLVALIDRQLAVFPDHREYLERRFNNSSVASLQFCNEIAGMVERIAGTHLDKVLENYRWLCAEILKEELHFRRTGEYRLSSFADALEQVYANREYMEKYVDGILASQLWWKNHAEVLRFYRDRFVNGNKPHFSHLEVGPGHGLFLHLAASSESCAKAEGWDVSDASLAATRSALDAMSGGKSIELRQIQLLEAPEGSFDSITFSEVLEHLEDPTEALRILHRLLAKGGRIFINAPVNSPAPDHLYLFKTPEAVVNMVEEAGFVVEETFFSPQTGATLERARKLRLSISAAIIATR
ncbi:MAG TPA: class I SAM-dependent methyltransferase [Rhizomicrobium sp.]|jgi:2-polyprenyl-3-methyl-5-hydroxy-6-metoxy-1,4-benzoquinol methylase|nr:class I SAM-dependent methyltransferase [Rhizomicrobium sp.]